MATQKREKIGLDILSMRIESGRKENDGGKKGKERWGNENGSLCSKRRIGIV
jgi:hypothetical protein